MEIRPYRSHDHDAVVDLWREVQVRTSSPEAAGFYERIGFQVEERISMGKILPPGEVVA